MRRTLIMAMMGMSLFATACSIDIEANPDGTLGVESTMTEAQIQQAIDRGIDDPSTEDLDVELSDGYMQVEGKGEDQARGGVNTVAFKARLFVDGDHLGADLYDAYWNGDPMPPWVVEAWNQALADGLERHAGKHPDSTLTSVEVTEGAITMRWVVETDQSG